MLKIGQAVHDEVTDAIKSALQTIIISDAVWDALMEEINEQLDSDDTFVDLQFDQKGCAAFVGIGSSDAAVTRRIDLKALPEFDKSSPHWWFPDDAIKGIDQTVEALMKLREKLAARVGVDLDD